MRKRICTIFLILSFASGLRAQFDALFSQYWATKTYYNPASAGCSSSDITALLVNRQQWVGMTNAPRTFFASADMPFFKFGKEQGLGISLLSDNIGLFANSSVSFDYSYKIDLWDGKVSIGTQVGFINSSFDGTKVNLKDLSDYHNSNDDAIPSTNVQSMSFDMGIGAYYTRDKAYAGVSVSHIFEPTINFDEKSSTYIGRSIYVMGGTSFPLEGYSIMLSPSIFAKSDFRVMQIDLTMRAEFNNKIWGGLTYRYNNAFVPLVGVNWKDISIGYAYDISTSKLFSVTGGSHEVFASYNFKLKLKGDSKRKYNKSLRYL